ncbi:MAG: FkbM family methyltransferase [Ferruginibacter sp.]
MTKDANILYAVYYLFYKISLKFQNPLFSKNYIKNRTVWLANIYDHLNKLNNKLETINGKALIVLKSGDDGSKIYLRPFSSDFQVYSQVIVQKSYQPVIEMYNQIFKLPPNNFIDLGANIGLTSVFFANTYKHLDIIAIEPFIENFEMAELNMRSNQIKNFSLIHGGIWNKKTKLALKRDFRDGKEWGINLMEDSKGEIEGFCLNELLNSRPITDILKIDIEGTEKILFEDSDYASKFLKRVKCLAMEIHDEFKCRDSIYAILNKNDFIYYNIQDMTVALKKNFI